jgi:hypothetical protein
LPLLLPELSEATFAIDVDILAALDRLDLPPIAGPVSFFHDSHSTVTLGRGGAAFVGVVRVALRHYKSVAKGTPAGQLADLPFDAPKTALMTSPVTKWKKGMPIELEAVGQGRSTPKNAVPMDVNPTSTKERPIR